VRAYLLKESFEGFWTYTSPDWAGWYLDKGCAREMRSRLGSIEERSIKVAASLGLPEDLLNMPHDPEKSSQTEIEYRLAWARTYLKKYGILDNSDRGVWVIVPEKRDIAPVDPQR